MRTIIAGSRSIIEYKKLEDAIEFCRKADWIPTTILSGGDRGADALGEQFAKAYGLPLEIYPAQWEKYGRSAGYERNGEMASKAELLIALWDGESRGTKHMIDLARKNGLKIHVHGCKYE